MDYNNLSPEQLEALQKKHREQLKENRQQITDRKKRTHRLIVHGLVAERFVPNCEQMSEQEFYDALSARINGGF